MILRLGIFIMWLIHFLPFRVIVAIGNGVGSLLYLGAAERRRVGAINLKLCFPDLGDEARKKLLRDNFKMFGRGLFERSILWWSSARRISSLIRVEGVEHFESVAGQPAILLTPHFVGMDVGGQWIAQHTDTVCMYANQKNQYMTELLLKKRARFRNQHLYSRQQGLRPILKGMRDGVKGCDRVGGTIGIDKRRSANRGSRTTLLFGGRRRRGGCAIGTCHCR